MGDQRLNESPRYSEKYINQEVVAKSESQEDARTLEEVSKDVYNHLVSSAGEESSPKAMNLSKRMDINRPHAPPPQNRPPAQPSQPYRAYLGDVHIRHPKILTYFELGQADAPLYATSDADVFKITFNQLRITVFLFHQGRLRARGERTFISGAFLYFEGALASSRAGVTRILRKIVKQAEGVGEVERIIICGPERGQESTIPLVDIYLQERFPHVKLRRQFELQLYPVPEFPPTRTSPTFDIVAHKQTQTVLVHQFNLPPAFLPMSQRPEANLPMLQPPSFPPGQFSPPPPPPPTYRHY